MNKTFTDFFYDSDNHKGFLEVLNTVDSEKLSDLLGVLTTNELTLYDRYIQSKIGFLTVSPLLENTFNMGVLTLSEKQIEVIKIFLILRYNQLLKVKDAINTDISVNNGNIRIENKSVLATSENNIAAFDTTDLIKDNSNKSTHDSDNTITEKKTDTKTIIENINALSNFYKQSMIDKIIDFIKDLFTLQVIA